MTTGTGMLETPTTARHQYDLTTGDRPIDEAVNAAISEGAHPGADNTDS
jgi:hypothetical protein